jgi:hypothetical protein
MSAADNMSAQAGVLSTAGDEAEYPPLGVLPKTLEMTACEVLTWIGYGRAITKNIYLRPVVRACWEGASDDKFIHSSVPDAKPKNDPINDATQTLMDALRSGRLQAWFSNSGVLSEVPTKVYRYALTIYARGTLETDSTRAAGDQQMADDYRLSDEFKPFRNKPIFFRTDDVRETLTPWPRKGPLGRKADPTPVGKSQQRANRPFDGRAAKTLLDAKKNSGQWLEPPTDTDCFAYLRSEFSGVNKEQAREIREEVWGKKSPRGRPKKARRITAT